MNNNNFLCARCRAAMCPDCLEIADEYAELLQMRTRELGRYAAQVDDLKYQLDLARKAAADWERTAKLGYPEVIQKWMDSEVGP
jgi:hypothetical protein